MWCSTCASSCLHLCRPIENIPLHIRYRIDVCTQGILHGHTLDRSSPRHAAVHACSRMHQSDELKVHTPSYSWGMSSVTGQPGLCCTHASDKVPSQHACCFECAMLRLQIHASDWLHQTRALRPLLLAHKSWADEVPFCTSSRNHHSPDFDAHSPNNGCGCFVMAVDA
jgi:hypothetical protein